jgi:hypothetical protein
LRLEGNKERGERLVEQSGGEGSTDVDQVVADHPEANPSFHPCGSFVTAAAQAVSAFEDADSTFATSPPLLADRTPFGEGVFYCSHLTPTKR